MASAPQRISLWQYATMRNLILDDLRNHGNLSIGNLDDKAASGLQKQIESEIWTSPPIHEKAGFLAKGRCMPYRPSLTLKLVESGKVGILLA